MRKMLIAVALAGLMATVALVPVVAHGGPVNACPKGFSQIPWYGSPDTDRNGDGQICMKSTPGGHTVFIDNNIPPGKGYR